MEQIVSAKGLVNWLEKQPQDTTYIYDQGCDCLNARYLRAMGLDIYLVGSMSFRADRQDHELPPDMDLIARLGDTYYPSDKTYGQALAYARTLGY